MKDKTQEEPGYKAGLPRKTEELETGGLQWGQEIIQAREAWEWTYNALPDLVMLVDREHRILWANEAMADKLGVAPSEVAGMTCYEHVHGCSDPPPFCPHSKLLADGQDHMVQINELRLGGDYAVSVTPLHDSGGQLIGSVHVARDVSQRVQAEAKLLERSQQLELLNSAGRTFNSTLDLNQTFSIVLEEVRKLLDVDICSIWLVDPESKELVCQLATGTKSEIVCGWRLSPKQGIAGAAYRSSECILVPDAQVDERHVKDIDRQTGLVTRSVLAIPLRVKEEVIGILEVLDQSAGRFKTTHLALMEPMAASAGIAIENARLYEQMQQEIAERRRVEAEREQLIKDLDAYAHTVAHGLKTPLGLIHGYCALIEEANEELSYKELQNYYRIISKTSLKMANIVNELLLLASVHKLDEIKLEHLDMAEIVLDLQCSLSHMIQKTGAEIVLPEEWPIAWGYAPWVKEVWTNYISNAIKYGGTPPRVELGAEGPKDGVVRFSIQDNGQGLTEEEQGRLFTPFSRLDLARAEGHGLGLSIVQRIVEKLGGQVGVESKVGEGSSFYFTLPSADQG